MIPAYSYSFRISNKVLKLNILVKNEKAKISSISEIKELIQFNPRLIENQAINNDPTANIIIRIKKLKLILNLKKYCANNT